MLNPLGLMSGHYECRSFEESLPILKEFLALEIVGEKNGAKIVKHANTDWRIIVHANGADAPIKSMRNHYGVRVTTNAEVDRATEYLEQTKDEFGIKIIKPRENHNAYSVHFYESGVASPEAVHDANALLAGNRDKWKLTYLEAVTPSIDGVTFLFADLNRNWWEITSANS